MLTLLRHGCIGMATLDRTVRRDQLRMGERYRVVNQGTEFCGTYAGLNDKFQPCLEDALMLASDPTWPEPHRSPVPIKVEEIKGCKPGEVLCVHDAYFWERLYQ
jgi:hypothetical protein